MNKKGKNKKGKVPNPIPSQEEKDGDGLKDLEVIGDKEEAKKPSETIENVVEKIDLNEERVPEIVTEIIAAPVERKDEETPKKPKRNRGKKKKGKEDDYENSVEEGPKETAVQPSAVEETNVDTLEAEREPLDIPIVTPTARKKKNKKKNIDQKAEEPVLPEPEQTVPEAKDIISDPDISEVKQEMTSQLEQEIQPSKKKNKKKKRNDSERSNKEEISCTSAFEKLIDVKDEETKMGKNIENNANVVQCIKSDTEVQPQKDTLLQKTVDEKDFISTDEANLVKSEESLQMPMPESKNKKKNKKDKKNIPKPEDTSFISESAIVEGPMPPSEDIIKEVPKDIAVEKSELSIEKTSPKPKAKIAKPVEKKRKGKQDNQADENPPQGTLISATIKSEEQLPQDKLETTEIQTTGKETVSETETKNIGQNLPTDDNSLTESASDQLKKLSLKDFEPLNIPDKGIGKKRKKGLKVSKTPDVSFEVLEPKIEMDTKPSDIESIELQVTSESVVVDESVIVKEQIKGELSKEPIPSEYQPELKPTMEPITQTKIQEHILLTPEILKEEDASKIEAPIPEKAEDTLKFETKCGKKRKKPQKKIEEVGKPQEPVMPSTSTEVTKDMGEKIDASNIMRMYDIEISSIKADESEGSVCDTVPDVTYPRSSSQQLPDDNNNSTVIREIFPLQESIPDPFAQQCVKPTKTDVIAKAKENTSPPKEEKTDLKSKMMEVNQDMEELRLSIERSLAELTSIEKNEEVAEKQFQECNIPPLATGSTITETNILQKKDDPEKNIQVPELEIFTEKSFENVKEAELIQDSKLFEDLFFSIYESKQSTKEAKLQEDTKSTSVDATIAIELVSDDKAKDITTKDIKNTAPMIDTKVDSATPMTTEQKPKEILRSGNTVSENKALTEQENVAILSATAIPLTWTEEHKTSEPVVEKIDSKIKPKIEETQPDTPPVCPARKDNKGKHKKKKGKQDTQMTSQPTQSSQSTSTSQSTTTSTTQEPKKEEKTDSKTENKSDSKDNKEKGKQQASTTDTVTEEDLFSDKDYEPIENFEDALTSSVDDVNKTFELIVKESQEHSNPKINIIASTPEEEKTPVSPPKNLLGHPDIPAPSNKRDYKKEKEKIPNEITAKVKIKDAVDVEIKPSKNTQTINKLKDLKDCKLSENEEFVYKYSFRKVFLQSSCHVCKKDLAGARVACCYCNLVFYCCIKHKDEDWPLHQALCFAVSTIGHLKDQKHIYADAKNITGHDYRLVRMQMIVSCEKILKRRLVPWEQEALLYPRMCAHVPCREWRQMKLTDCQGCGQISFCKDYPEHYPKAHSRWCKSYSLYHKLVCYQQTKGRLEPRLPTKVMQEQYEIPEKINEVLAGMYEEKIDMNDIQYAALTQLATAPLTAAYSYQLYRSKNTATNGYKKSIFTIHVVGAELQFEADALNKWEVFLLHLRPDLQEIRVVLINYNLNPSNLPLELLGKIKLCEQCRQDKRRVVLHFQDKRTYAEYKSSEDFIVPDIVCAFNPSIQRSSVYNGKDPWPSTINAILKMKVPFLITGYTITELHKDCIRIKECSETGFSFISEPKSNSFASVRPDRNFISDDEMPLLFKNYCFAIICG